jgi:transposase
MSVTFGTVAPVSRSAALSLAADQRAVLERWVRSGMTPQRLVFRSRIVLLAADGMPSKHIAAQLDTSQDTVRLWRRRFAAGGPEALVKDAPGRGRKRQITAAQEQQVIDATLHTVPPHATQWSLRTMAAAQGLSPASIHRIWDAHHLQPHRIRTFKLSNDPQFLQKLTDVVGLYVNPPEKALVFCVDEKSQIQALQRSQPGLPMRPGRAGTMTHDYKRHGTTTLFAALNVLEGTVIGSCLPRHRHQEFRRFLNVLEAQTPPDVAVHAIVDNYATHTHPAIERWLHRHPRFHLHFIPTSASWLNLVEVWFSHLTKNQIRRGDFLGVRDLIDAIQAYIHHYNQQAGPFIWTAPAERILDKVTKCRAISESLH